jgi:hypothetical protein
MAETLSATRGRITAAIQHYLAVLQHTDGGKRATLHDLAKALDGLVEAYHQTADVEPDSQTLAPRVEETKYRQAAAAAFPELHMYAVVDPQDGPEQQVGLSVAAGDLGEIAGDLLEVLWLFDNSSHNNAVWQFRFGYQSHWGRHLHELRLYLHSMAAW